MERLQAFEKMLEDIVLRYEQEKKTMEALKAQGKEKLQHTGSTWAIG